MFLTKRVGSVVFLTGWILTALGCGSGGDAIVAFDPVSAGKAMVAQLDANNDGRLSKEEISALPAVANSFHLFDLEGDGDVSSEDVARRFQLWASLPGGSMPLQCHVLLKGKPLAGANVRLVPEDFMGDGLPAATGTTDAQGRSEIISEGNDSETNPEVWYGIYKVEITHANKSIPSQFNTKTKLGQEVAPESRATENVLFRL